MASEASSVPDAAASGSGNGDGSAMPGGTSAAAAAHANMHFDTTTGKWMYEDAETGQEYEWNVQANAWALAMSEEMVEAQQKAYSVAGVDEAVSVVRVTRRARGY